MQRGCPVLKLSSAWLVLVAALFFAQSQALGQNNRLYMVDEFGGGLLFNSAGQTFALNIALQPDPGPGGLGLTLSYNLLSPPGLVAGDVFMQDGVGGPIFDVVRFNPAGTGGNPAYPASLVFYSDSSDGADAPADTPSPPTAFYPNTVTILEVGLEGGVENAIYTPTANQPGFIPGFNVTYNLISDGVVPEPGAVALLFPLTLAAWRRRRFFQASRGSCRGSTFWGVFC